jgi:ABC-type Zn uptake system ZnuABC Zn-binding protein ZnuA
MSGLWVTTAGERLRVVASFLPAYSLAAQVAGEAAEVSLLGAPSENPHEFQLKPSELRRLGQSKVLCVNGLGLEPWLPRVLDQLASRPRIVELGAGLEAELIWQDGNPKRPNPHIWLDPLLAARAATNLAEAFGRADPAHAQIYRENGQRCAANLRRLDGELAELLASVRGEKFVTLHDAFPYLARRYGLGRIGVIQASPDSEASPRHMGQLLERIRSEGARAVFSEKGESARLAERLARDAGVKLGELETLETGEAGPASYEQGMRRNAAALRRALSRP